MSRSLNDKEMDSLEDLIDKTSLSSVLESIAVICQEKAQHIQESYGDDDDLVRAWDRASARIDQLALGAVARDVS